MNIKRFLLLAVLSIVVVALAQIGCDELITERITIIEAGHPIADFGLLDPADGFCCVPCVAVFSDLSDGPRQIYQWNFGDDSILVETLPPDLSDYTAPVHTYLEPGIYTVTLTIKDTTLDGQDTEIHERFIYVGTVATGFSANPSSACVGEEVEFILDEYNIQNSYEWDFGDGSDPVIGLNPTHVYDAEGTYTVKLEATDDCGTDSMKVDVAVGQCPEVAFGADINTGCLPLEVTFTNSTQWLGKEFVSRLWEFGDGNTSTERDPVYSYTTGGEYDVTLTVTTSGGTSSETKLNFIIPVDSTAAEFDIEGNQTFCFSLTQDFQVNFINQSAGTLDSVRWYFGDGGTDISTDPVYIYTVPGIYDVTLMAYGLCGDSTIVKEGFIILADDIISDNLQLDTQLVVGDGTAPSSYRISDITTTEIITGRTWYLDDVEVGANVTEITLVFADPNTYTVRMVASNDCGEAETSIDIIIGSPP
ncbi:MAG: PKD domain-containing protein [Candidatus Zixiibacteriota bacterium]|nr:MAG: PKD domain-containing protein [candidate division Zixibacteria bacterium]